MGGALMGGTIPRTACAVRAARVRGYVLSVKVGDPGGVEANSRGSEDGEPWRTIPDPRKRPGVWVDRGAVAPAARWDHFVVRTVFRGRSAGRARGRSGSPS